MVYSKIMVEQNGGYHSCDAVPLAEPEEELDRMVCCFDDVYRRRMLRMNVNKIKLQFLKGIGCRIVISV